MRTNQAGRLKLSRRHSPRRLLRQRKKQRKERRVLTMTLLVAKRKKSQIQMSKTRTRMRMRQNSLLKKNFRLLVAVRKLRSKPRRVRKTKRRLLVAVRKLKSKRRRVRKIKRRLRNNKSQKIILKTQSKIATQNNQAQSKRIVMKRVARANPNLSLSPV